MSVDLERNRIALTMKSGVVDQPRRAEGRWRTGWKIAEWQTECEGSGAVPRIPKSGEIAANGMRFK